MLPSLLWVYWPLATGCLAAALIVCHFPFCVVARAAQNLITPMPSPSPSSVWPTNATQQIDHTINVGHGPWMMSSGKWGYSERVTHWFWASVTHVRQFLIYEHNFQFDNESCTPRWPRISSSSCSFCSCSHLNAEFQIPNTVCRGTGSCQSPLLSSGLQCRQVSLSHRTLAIGRWVMLIEIFEVDIIRNSSCWLDQCFQSLTKQLAAVGQKVG